MKKSVTVLLVLLSLVFLLQPADAAAADAEFGVTLIVCSEGMSPAMKVAFQAELTKLLTTSPTAHRIIVVRGQDHTPLLNVSIPGGSIRERLRNGSLIRGLAALQEFLRNPSRPGAKGIGQIGIPQLPATYWEIASGHGRCRIVLIGTPIYDDARYPFWSFANGRFPADAVVSSAVSVCPLINRNYRKIPQDTEIVFLCPTEWGSNQRHRDHVIRWTRLLMQENLGGKLKRVTNSVASAFGATAQDSDSQFEAVEPDGRSLIGMWQLRNGTNQSGFPEEGVPQPAEPEVSEATPAVNDSAPQLGTSTKISSAVDSATVPVQPDFNHSPPTIRSGRESLAGLSVNVDQGLGPESPLESETDQALNVSSIPDGTDAAGNEVDSAFEEPERLVVPEHVTALTQRNDDPLNSSPRGLPPGDSPTTSAVSTASAVSAAEDSLVERVQAPLQKLADERAFPAELTRSLVAKSRVPDPGHLAVLVWTSDCPHADLDLHLTGQDVRRDLAQGADGTKRDRIEWCFADSLAGEIWINVFRTHRDVEAKLSIIDLQTGAVRDTTNSLGSVADRGQNSKQRSQSKAWKRIVMESHVR